MLNFCCWYCVILNNPKKTGDDTMLVWTRENSKEFIKIIDIYNRGGISEEEADSRISEKVPLTKLKTNKCHSSLKRYIIGEGERSTYKGHSVAQMLGTLDYVLEIYGKDRALKVAKNYENNHYPSNKNRNRHIEVWLTENMPSK